LKPGGFHLLVLVSDQFLSRFWLMANHMVISHLREASNKGILYHLIYFYCVQKDYIHSYSKLNFLAQSKESPFVVQVQRSPICSLQMTICSFVGQPHMNATPSLIYCTNMKRRRDKKSTKAKPNYFSAPTPPIICSKK